ncbi:hypothetical protein ACLD02_04805 [Alloalcanivorax sp. C16-2]|uniref:hypothetical protein n=1 Tax=Alloalcanivorax TaxID=3020832 RepID=UPI0019327A81|nr:hypothetical protein [Alloalcanivorax marinus]MBL7250393.1 hypothetical protein [Alloalcanivorax marinus]
MPSTLLRRALPVLALSLAACGGDHDHRRGEASPPATTPTALTIDEHNGDGLLGEVMFITTLMTLNVTYDLNLHTFALPVTSCENDGTLRRDRQAGGDQRITAIEYRDCLTSLGPDTTLTLDGELAIDYEDDTPGSPFRIQASGFTSHLRETRQGTLYGNRTRLDGALRMTPDPVTGLPFASISDADLTLDFDYLEDDIALNHWRWRLQDFAIPFSVNPMTGGMGMGASGRLTLFGDGQARGFVDVYTDAPLSTSMAACPDSGDLTVTGADGGYIRLTIPNANEAVLTTNGDGDLINCGQLLDLTDPMNVLVIAH